MLLTMSAKIIALSAPGTSYFVLGGIIMPARQRKSEISASFSVCSFIAASIVEQGCQASLHAVGDVQRDRLDGGGWIDPTRGDEHAAINDEQVPDVMASTPGVHHRPRRIVAHACRAQQVPTAIPHRVSGMDAPCPGGGEDFPPAIDREIQHPAGVLTD